MAKKRKPRKPYRQKVIGFRVSDSEYETFHHLAHAAGLTISEWLRLHARRAANMATG